ncbi:unnamed protein product [Cunninghamella blakesleeana]
MMSILPFSDANNNHSHNNDNNDWDDISQLSINDLLSLNKNDPDLMEQVLLAKQQENNRKSAQEIRQVEENRLKNKYVDFDMQQDFQLSPYSLDIQIGNENHHNTDENWNYPLQMNQTQNDDPILLTSSPPQTFTLTEQNYQAVDFFSHNENDNNNNNNHDYIMDSISSTVDHHSMNPMNQHYQPIVSSHSVTSLTDSISSHSPSMESSSSLLLENHNHHNTSPIMSSPQPTSSISSSKKTQPQTGGKLIEKKSKKHSRRQLSTSSLPGFSSSTHVLKWSTNIKRQSQQLKEQQQQQLQQQLQLMNKEPQPPLDHDQVMEALRAKLLKIHSSPSSTSSSSSNDMNESNNENNSSSSSNSNMSSNKNGSSSPLLTTNHTESTTSSPPPSPPPKSPPVNTHPRTGVLFLDLKNKPNRRRKSSPPLTSF